MHREPRPSPRQLAHALRELPPPALEALAHSERLVRHIGEAIDAAGGRIPFSRYMELALYAPGLGYYAAGARKFGPDGDFVTAPELAPLFSRVLARQAARLLAAAGGDTVLEAGAGTGTMAADVLAELQRLERLPRAYLILEPSPDLRQRQRATLEERVPELLPRVRWLDALPSAPLQAVVLANEVLDAMPATRFRIVDGRAQELFVARAGDGFALVAGEPADPRVARRLSALAADYRLPEGYESELNLWAEDWVRTLSGCIGRGAALLIDYGFPGGEFYHPQRVEGTLMCHYRHRAHADALLWPGLQDITAHVDFTAVAEAAAEAGWQVAGFAGQGSFLLAGGLLELLSPPDADPRVRLDEAAQVRRLTQPEEMGELFKVLALTKGLPLPLEGFALRDERGRL